MEILKRSAPSKRKVAEWLYIDSGTSSVDKDHDAKQALLSFMLPDYDPETDSAPAAGRDPLLSQCYGNRSAALYQMGKYNVSIKARIFILS